jgi:hypothetical protein
VVDSRSRVEVEVEVPVVWERNRGAETKQMEPNRRNRRVGKSGVGKAEKKGGKGKEKKPQMVHLLVAQCKVLTGLRVAEGTGSMFVSCGLCCWEREACQISGQQ